MTTKKIAVVGSGISGLSAAWLLSRRHRVTLFEAGQHLGGHANTVDVETPKGRVAVDTGFIVYNEPNYPNLTALFAHLDVDVVPTWMTFALSLEGGAYEYSGTGLTGFFGQPANVVRPAHWRMLRDIARFFRTARQRIDAYPADVSLGTFLASEGYSETFVDDHIVPMGAAIWSTSMSAFVDYPAASFIDFYDNHGLLSFAGRPEWRTVRGGSREYVRRLAADADIEVQLGTGIRRIARHPGYVQLTDTRGAERPFDQVVIATHADQALAILHEPDAMEAGILGKFTYQRNQAVLHSDASQMPRRRRLWSSWNYMKAKTGTESDLSVTYWMNSLQKLPTETDLFVSLNAKAEIDPDKVHGVYDYDHPVFSTEAVAAQPDLWALQGHRSTWYCGSYFGYGFHEDGVQSGLAVAEQLGGVRRPWTVENESARIFRDAGNGLIAAE